MNYKNIRSFALRFSFSLSMLTSASFMMSIAVQAAAPVKKPGTAAAKKTVETKGGISEAEWTKKFNDKIDKNMGKPDVKEPIQTVVSIKIDKDGALTEATVDKSSGDEKADEVAINAIKNSAPFGPMPAVYKGGLNLMYTIKFAPARKQADIEPFMNRVRNKIAAVWRAPETKTECQVSVLFVLDKAGAIKQVSIKKPSGYKIVDDTAVSAIRKAAPFGALPDPNIESFPIEYTLPAGPPGHDLKKYQFNGVPISQAGWQVSRGGATLQPLEIDKSIDRKLEAREWAIKEKIESLKSTVSQTSDEKKRSSLLIELAQCYCDVHNYEEAGTVLTRAAEIEKANNPEGEAHGLILSQLAETHSKLNKFPEAEKEFEESVAILRKSSQNKAKLVETLTNYARTLYKMNKAKDAEALYKEIRETKVE
jgi:TonB family protein